MVMHPVMAYTSHVVTVLAQAVPASQIPEAVAVIPPMTAATLATIRISPAAIRPQVKPVVLAVATLVAMVVVAIEPAVHLVPNRIRPRVIRHLVARRQAQAARVAHLQVQAALHQAQAARVAHLQAQVARLRTPILIPTITLRLLRRHQSQSQSPSLRPHLHLHLRLRRLLLRLAVAEVKAVPVIIVNPMI